MEDIQHDAGVSGSQLYHYFANKRDLIEAVITAQTEVVLANELIANISSLQDLRRWRDAVVDAARRLGHRAGCPLAALAEQIRDTDPSMLDLVAAGLRQLTDLVAKGLDTICARGELHADTDTARLAVAMVTAYEGGLLVARIQRDVSALEVALDTVIDVIETYSSRP